MTMSTFVDKLVKIPEEMKVLLWFYQSGPLVPDKIPGWHLCHNGKPADGPIVSCNATKFGQSL